MDGLSLSTCGEEVEYPVTTACVVLEGENPPEHCWNSRKEKRIPRWTDNLSGTLSNAGLSFRKEEWELQYFQHPEQVPNRELWQSRSVERQHIQMNVNYSSLRNPRHSTARNSLGVVHVTNPQIIDINKVKITWHGRKATVEGFSYDANAK